MSDPIPPQPTTREDTPSPARDLTPTPVGRRSWKSRLLELFLWFLVAVATAAALVLLSEEILPANF
jgi:hypothetical protein